MCGYAISLLIVCLTAMISMIALDIIALPESEVYSIFIFMLMICFCMLNTLLLLFKRFDLMKKYYETKKDK